MLWSSFQGRFRKFVFRGFWGCWAYQLGFAGMVFPVHKEIGGRQPLVRVCLVFPSHLRQVRGCLSRKRVFPPSGRCPCSTQPKKAPSPPRSPPPHLFEHSHKLDIGADKLGPLAVPFYQLFWGEGSPTKIGYSKKVPLLCLFYSKLNWVMLIAHRHRFQLAAWMSR